MISQKDKFRASDTYAFADTELVEGTKRQEEKKDYSTRVWKEDKQKAHDIYVSEFKPHVPSLTKEELDKIPMSDWDKELCDHYWDNQDMCHRCGVPKYD